MRSPFAGTRRSSTPAPAPSLDPDPFADATATIERCERDLAPLTERLEALTARLATIDAELAQSTAERADALLAGTQTLTLGAQIRELTDERAALADVLRTLSDQILALRGEQAGARAALEQLQLRRRAAESRERAHAASAAMLTALREFVGERFPAIMRELRASHAAAHAVSLAAGESFPGELFPNPALANLAIALEDASGMLGIASPL